jgi:hypothetical protein
MIQGTGELESQGASHGRHLTPMRIALQDLTPTMLARRRSPHSAPA